MPKCLFVDPNGLRAPNTIHFDDIPVNAYSKTVADERDKYGDENLVRIWRDITILREFESMLNQIKTNASRLLTPVPPTCPWARPTCWTATISPLAATAATARSWRRA